MNNKLTSIVARRPELVNSAPLTCAAMVLDAFREVLRSVLI